MQLPKFLKKYFWEVDFKKLDFKKQSQYIILRLLEYGNAEAIRWLLRNFSKRQIREVILKRRGLSPRALNFWSSFFNVNKEKILCLRRPYQQRQKSHWLR